ncbi:uncharacterized protein LOC142162081 [Nicotiana tabacum]|uniref:Uncharacterized protein LOC142162081 n=1 Tax=Nicotiana tabacum TaxID=4097 RepID=A0AC58RP34_TOBAC
MYPNRDWFVDSQEGECGVIHTANNNPLTIYGIGSIRLRNYDGLIRILTDVRYVPELKKKLISVGALESKGFKVIVENEIMRICSGALVPKNEAALEYMSRVPYANAIGSLMYAMVCTRPGISHAIGVVSKYMHDPGKEHWQALKWILRYIHNTIDVGLFFEQEYSQYLSTVALSTIEEEYMTITKAVKEAIWLQGLLRELELLLLSCYGVMAAKQTLLEEAREKRVDVGMVHVAVTSFSALCFVCKR